MSRTMAIRDLVLSAPWRRPRRIAAAPDARGLVGCARARASKQRPRRAPEVVSVVWAYRVSAGAGASLVADTSTTQTACKYGPDDTAMDIVSFILACEARGRWTRHPIRGRARYVCARDGRSRAALVVGNAGGVLRPFGRAQAATGERADLGLQFVEVVPEDLVP